MAKMARVEKLASVALVIAGAGSLILLEIYFPKGETPNRLIGALALVLYLAVFTAITLMVWRRGEGRFHSSDSIGLFHSGSCWLVSWSMYALGSRSSFLR